MTQRVFVLAFLLVAVAMLIDGRVPKKYCDVYLEHHWYRASSRTSDENTPRRPTQDEADQLRTAIRVCRPFTTRFDLVDPLSDGEVYGSITLITLAVELDDPDLLASLVAKGHSVDGLPNWGGITTLQFATYQQASRSFFWLLENGVDPNARDTNGATALMYAAPLPQGEFNGVRALIDAGVDVDMVGPQGWTPLAAAVRSGRFANAATLVEAGADIESTRSFLLELSKNTPSDLPKLA